MENQRAQPKLLAENFFSFRMSNLKEYLKNDGKTGLAIFTNENGKVALRLLLRVQILNSGGSLEIRSIEKDRAASPPSQHFTLESTPCHLGGRRYWFLCSYNKPTGEVCGKRVSVLYKWDGSFGCRHCLDLTYQSRNVVRNKDFVLRQYFALHHKKEALKAKIKRREYGGKPTKRMQQVMRMEERCRFFYDGCLGWIEGLEKRFASIPV